MEELIKYKSATAAQSKKGVERVVYLGKKKVGCIFRVPNTLIGPHDFQYVPAGVGKNAVGSGEIYSTLSACKRSIETGEQ